MGGVRGDLAVPTAARRRCCRGCDGFTLIEMVIALAVMAVLVTLAAPVVQMQAQREREAQLRQSLRDIRGAIDAYRKASDEGRIAKPADRSGYPPNLEVLVQGVVDAKDPKARPIFFLRRIPRDPMNLAAEGLAARSWALRSYASPPDDPREGDDVFDVYSRSEKTGTNGVPYRDW